MCVNMMKYQLFFFILVFGLVFRCVYTGNNVGCLFSSELCNPDEECFDDNAFGRCRFPFDTELDNYRHSLESGELQLLVREFSRLFAGGYRWRHEYTQCAVQNILYTIQHKISYDPGLCARIMHLTLPEVPPEVLAELESPEPNELAFIKFKPNRNDPKENMYAEEVYDPLAIEISKELEVKEQKKRSPDPPEEKSYLNEDWLKSLYDDLRNDKDDKIANADKTSLFRKLLEIADDTGKLFEQRNNREEDPLYTNVFFSGPSSQTGKEENMAEYIKPARLTDEDIEIPEQYRTDEEKLPYKSDFQRRPGFQNNLNDQPMFSEGGTQWVNSKDDFDYILGNDIIDSESKKRMWEPNNELPESNEITPFEKGKYDNYPPYEHTYGSHKQSFGKGNYDDNKIRLKAKEPHGTTASAEKDKNDESGIAFKEKDKSEDDFGLKSKYDSKSVSFKEKYKDGHHFTDTSKYDDIGHSPKKVVQTNENKKNNKGKSNIYKGLYDNDIVELMKAYHEKFPNEFYLDESKEEPAGYDSPPVYDEDNNFRWNYKHINKGVDNDLTKFSKDNNNGIRKMLPPSNSLKDVIEDDYLEDQLYAILPVDNGMSTYTRKRYDIKKPGPMYLDDEHGRNANEMADDGTKAFLSSLTKSRREHQLFDLLTPPVVAQKSSTIVVPSREVIDARQRITVVTGVSRNPFEKGTGDLASPNGKDKTFERLAADQPELLEGIDDLTNKDVKDEDRMANAAQTGEGHIGNKFEAVDGTRAYITIKEEDKTEENAKKLVETLEKLLNLPKGSFSDVRIKGKEITFKVNPNKQNLSASAVAAKAEEKASQLASMTNIHIEVAGIGDKVKYEVLDPNKDRRLFILAFSLCGGVAGLLLAAVGAFLIRKHSRSREKLQNVSHTDIEPSQDYQDLCRQRMAAKSNDKPENIHNVVPSPKKMRSLSQEGQVSSSSHSSTSSWNEEPVTSNMDITTGHIILAYMEDHLKNKDRLDREWEGLCAYEAELCSTTAATVTHNIKKNRYTDVLPYDHSRVLLTEVSNVAGSDYINASSITDHDPRNPAYIATQGPLPQTAADFWQMIWEQGSVVIVMLSRLMENGVAMCHRYWPEEGSEVYHIYEVHLVSEHIWCDDYLVRSFYLKNLRTNETRTVTQFHFMSWPDNGVPNSTKALLEFRRKVNKSYRGRSCPIVVHCGDGIGRTGTYCLIDMVLNRMAKGAKEIDIAATLEHVRDQRAGMVKTKAQFEFVLMAIAEEVHAILKALSQ